MSHIVGVSILQTPFDPNNDPKKVHSRNLDIIHDVCTTQYTKINKLLLFLQGKPDQIDMNQIAQYYSLIISLQPSLETSIVLPGVDINDYLSTHKSVKNEVILFDYDNLNTINVDEINKKRDCKMKVERITKLNPCTIKFELHPRVQDNKCNKFSRVVVGGTFDRLHAGHKVMLTELAYICNYGECVICLSEGKMLENKKYKELLQSYDERVKKVTEFMNEIKPGIKCEKLLDPFGATLTQENLEALVASEETFKGAQLVNTRRAEKNWKPLHLAIIPTVQALSESVKLSSTSLREEEFKRLSKLKK